MSGKKFREEAGVAMITVVVLSAVLMMLGGGMYFVAARENRMTQADYVGGQAFYYAEGGIENAIDIINYAGTETQLTRPRTDQSSDGVGYLMDPVPANRQDPTDPIVMQIGNQSYTVWADTIRFINGQWEHCEGCGLNLTLANPAYLLITAEAQSGDGYRRLQQRVRLEASGYPMAFYIDGTARTNGTPYLSNQSIYVNGDFEGRENLTMNINDTDLVYGGKVGVFATGDIQKRYNQTSPIYTEDGLQNAQYWDANYINDRDSRGPAGFTYDGDQFPFDDIGLSTSQLLALKGMAQTNGLYLNPESGNIIINQGDLPAYEGQSIVVYVEYSGGNMNQNEVGIRFDWPDPFAQSAPGQVIIVIKQGTVNMNAVDIKGSLYCEKGSIKTDGGGGGSFTGFIWGKGLQDIGNFNFNMTEAFLSDPPFFSWSVVRETGWTEIDR